MIKLLTFGVAAALLVLASPATAQNDDGLMVNRSCAGPNCTWIIKPAGAGLGKVIKVAPPATEAELAEQTARIAEWESVCDPRVSRDRFGVSRYSYGPACPNGVPTGPLR
jgi:hypothetical protein